MGYRDMDHMGNRDTWAVGHRGMEYRTYAPHGQWGTWGMGHTRSHVLLDP